MGDALVLGEVAEQRVRGRPQPGTPVGQALPRSGGPAPVASELGGVGLEEAVLKALVARAEVLDAHPGALAEVGLGEGLELPLEAEIDQRAVERVSVGWTFAQLPFPLV